MPNAELAYRVLDYIEAHPEKHDQQSWVSWPSQLESQILEAEENKTDPRPWLGKEEMEQHCGTTACFAGWTALLTGRKANITRPATLDDGSPVDWYAQRALGINNGQANALFYHTDNFAEVHDAVAKIFGPRPVK